jgi:DNA helicase-2/ATP-dependent DNA helicase PcrA
MTKTPLTSRANAQQLEAITTTEGPLLIIAGPGSGKTFTLVERIIYLLTEKAITPEHIMVVTFTDKAAQELTTRISNRLDQIGVSFNLNEMYLGTFHSICLRWLQDHREFTRLKHNFILMDEFDQLYFVYQRFSEFEALKGITHLADTNMSAWDRSARLVKWINTVAEEALDIEILLSAPDEAIQALGRCAQLYHAQLEENNALDFSTIQREALKLLRDYPSVRDALKEHIAYVMVDEYQDTNTVQERILLELVGTNNPNLCVVGDDDQGIYRFRGATIRNILQFGSAFTGPHKCVALETNYRSHEAIIEFCSRWMAGQDWTHEGQTFRYHKQIIPCPTEFPAMPAVIRVSAQSDAAWHEEILAFLQALKTEGQLTDWNQAAFLFRSVKHDKVRALAAFLEQHGIPVYSPRANLFFDREEVRLMIGALIFLFPQFPQARQWQADAHLEIWDYYDKECFAAFAEQLRHPENAELLKWARQKAKKHLNLTENTDYAFSGLFYELLQFPLFSRYLDENLLKDGLQQSRAMRNLGLFSQLLNKFEYLHHITVFQNEFMNVNLKQLFNRFLRFLKDGGINEYEDEAEYAPSGYVSFLTIHQAKGLEFPVVLVDSLSSVPIKQYGDLEEKLEQGYLLRPPFEPLAQTKNYDFRRLYYTAFSRAQNLLVLTASEKTSGRRTPSKYFQDYYKGLPSWHDPALRLAELPLEKIKQANLKREYSFTSHITVYENCAEQYRFFRALDFAPVRRNAILFGTLVHQTIEDIHRTVLRNEQDRLSEDQVRSWFDTNYAYITRRERVYLSPAARYLAVKQVLNYYRRQNGDWSRIRQTEVDVSLVKEQYILTGKIDLIAGQNDTVELVDFKSERKPDVNDLKDRDKLTQYRRQLEVYAHIVEQRTGQKISKTHLYYTSEEDGNPYITFQRDGQSTQETIKTFDTVVSRIEARDFAIPVRPPKLCKECDLRHYCDAKNWKFRSNNS